MPLYICNSKKNVLTPTTKAQIANDITDAHCSVTGAPPLFVHVVFFEEAPQFPLDDKALFVRGTIRKGRSDQQKDDIATAVEKSLAKNGQVDPGSVSAVIRETPASWVLEGGEIMPEPGEEDAWFAAQQERRKQAGLPA